MKSRKPVAGKVTKNFDRFGKIMRQIEREKNRHTNTMAILSAERADAALLGNPHKLGKVAVKELEERQKHRHKLDDLERRAREVWK